MAKTADTIAIYSRKSRYTGKGESIGNQIDLCREYIRTHYGDAAAEHAVVFEDEGFSGGNLNRPDFKKMMAAAKERKFKAIVASSRRQLLLRERQNTGRVFLRKWRGIDEFPDFFRITLKHRCPFPVTLPSQQVINRTTATTFSPGMKLNYHPAPPVP